MTRRPTGPFGPRRVTYADYTASGRSLTFIEDYLRAAVLPLYANTHTESSGTGLPDDALPRGGAAHHRDGGGRDADAARGHLRRLGLDGRHRQARRRARPALARRARRALRPARPDPGRGASGRVHRALRAPLQRAAVARVHRRRGHHPRGRGRSHRPGAAGAGAASATPTGRCASAPSRPPPTSPASCPTRARSPCCSTATARCRCGTSRPRRRTWTSRWRPIGRRRTATRREAHLDEKDAVFISVHKLIGGPGTPGVLVARRDLFQNRVPTVVGGGTVAYVNTEEHLYLADPEHREEAGTPDIIGSIRAGPRVPAQGAGRRGRHRGARGVVHRAGHRALGARARHRHPGRPARPPAVHRQLHGPPQRPVPASQPGGRAAQRPVRHPVARWLLLCRARTATGCWASTWRRPTGSSGRSCSAARASSPAGCGSTSTTSSARPCSSTSSMPWSWSRPTAGGCCRSTGSMPRPGLWRHVGGTRGSRRCRWRTSATRTARCATTRTARPLPESALAQHLADARALLRDAAAARRAAAGGRRPGRGPAVPRPALVPDARRGRPGAGAADRQPV